MQRTSPPAPASCVAPYAARPDPGLPVPAYWAERIAADLPGRSAADPPGGGAAVRAAAAGYWDRRGLPTDAAHTAAGPGAEPLLLALLAAIGGDVVVARPSAAWHVPLVRLLGRRPVAVPTPSVGGGAPDPFTLLEAVRRARGDGAEPRVVVLAAADDPSGTVTPPELLHEVCEAAEEAGLLLVSDETYGDAVHRPHETMLLSPAEMLPARTVVISDLGAALAPPGWPAAVVRFPATERGTSLRTDVLRHCADLRALLPGPVADAAAHALSEPSEVRAHLAAANRLHAAMAGAACDVVGRAGALSRPPEAGFHLYADFSPLRSELAAAGVTDAESLEAVLTDRLGRPAPGAHRFGDDPEALRVRIDTGPLHGTDASQRAAALASPAPLALPHVAAAVAALASALETLTTATD
ncbi:aminotransferase class I/II-fold pyridoxal phosphate-dependent enzyme [Streptomyces sp. NPDC088354]|uniref:aminotransferase class I/II-fold pyridoxal phosphate-dependent enzyme n=1 Tax=unclassified Streptomyces TaxID=2593676 RepID=UPI0029B5E848|nr:aminotransferase class I/II-fold pyridoxal phosphate-dependent enzyme [Streptomyces sp. MI02-7b]MDX3077580.1 aminotransferase class I/II-fold pyridoxal phosphate-dependent enzyme [Streptomyces sp. MI02-7b]